ncbi:MAG: preprotein translocase subunit SecA [Nitrospinae bacterium RIFCSPLOWO2_02_FULL_39_110]|nr:MAG: preprotein translocase subunit SecA [Nitrospinae bacterium RIFCSPHIGHO2_02_39_11]OGV98138.1 MAG: preprotein translocase subunit SecA [Nitrospinae bacterium RIFCSPHIGHO2_12_FULL_39_42]OGV99583.1 MAG: preprotein translocase subunit SecA [Nitrospinae bacterium RIFCSPHIGHO2_02_FULL_39_82]OGW03587.1 MAG: preprotein translocase subunit SecA [Nitrospinae bacterium RIFCSPLOWO2_02_FULL_39_110]OGW04133.1 MAG: preprotein translocase subunit SecA [Nitrospinae bacterium RIFCSPLOWO2_02_39_17]OGW0850
MISSFIRKIIGSRNERELKRLQPYVDMINRLEPEIQKLSNEDLRAKTIEFKERFNNAVSNLNPDILSEGQKEEVMENTLNELLPEAFAVVREVAKRTLNMRHFDVQLIGGIALHEGKIAEMKTGEGKTLVATLPVYLNSLTGKGVHVITVNDYLARRDAAWMSEIYKFLGLSVGIIQHEMDDRKRQEAYRCNVIYGTNNEFGFDYLRDNMKFSIDSYVQRELNYAIVDEVDSILIDEARTPLIISGLAEESTDKYYKIDRIIPRLKKETDYQIDEKVRSAILTEDGVATAEGLLSVDNLYDPSNIEVLHHVNQALRAHTLFKKDVDYIVKDDKVVIVDEFTGRLMPGRRWSDGLHQAVEAKEGCKIENENQTLATITFQNYFRLYNKLAGMTGTADTEAAEFQEIYGLEVLVIPPNKPMIRTDNPDMIYRTEKEKFNAIVREIEELHKMGQPVLVGTISIEKSERISDMLKKKVVKHHVLNAKYHEKEAEIVAQAGRFGAVTIATNMAGRGTDILLGGNPDFLIKRRFENEPDLLSEEGNRIIEEFKMQCEKEKQEVVKLGGLHILGTERHEARRIDNQLRGRSGRQGDPGSSRFYLSLEDDLLRIFGSDRISGLMERLGMEEDQPIEHKMITRAIENAQRKVESHNFDIRKHLLEYDDVMNKQREVIYEQRRQVLEGGNLREMLFEMVEEVVENTMSIYVDGDKHPGEWDIHGLRDSLIRQFSLNITSNNGMLSIEGGKNLDINTINSEIFKEVVVEALQQKYDGRELELGGEMIRHLEKMVMLQIIDNQWKDHLLVMDHIKEGIGFRGYAQKNPLNEYKKEGFDAFAAMIQRIREEITEYLFKIQVAKEGVTAEAAQKRQQRIIEHRGEVAEERHSQVKRDGKKVGRNDPCPCGSGKKYKKCCGV